MYDERKSLKEDVVKTLKVKPKLLERREDAFNELLVWFSFFSFKEVKSPYIKKKIVKLPLFTGGFLFKELTTSVRL